MKIKQCQLCDSKNITLVIDLGQHPLADTFLKDLEQKEEYYPLQVFLCKSCGYAGLSHIVSAPVRYQKTDYSYTSSNSPIATAHFKEMADQAVRLVKIAPKDLVIDIGSNVGTLLKSFEQIIHCRILGVEPSANIARLARKEHVPTLQNFFSKETVLKMVKKYGNAKVIVCTNVFNHVNNVRECMENIDRLLTKDGYFIFETPYLLDLVENISFDTIYLEHVSYFAIKPLQKFFKRFGFYIQYLEKNDYMGGSIRVYVSREKTDKKVVKDFINAENKANLFSTKTYESFMKEVNALRYNLYRQLFQIKASGKKVIAVGAATKGNTLLNYFKIDNSLIDFITDSSALKIGKFTPGSHIPIKSDKDINKDITFALVLSWNIVEFLKKKLGHLNLTFIVPQAKKYSNKD